MHSLALQRLVPRGPINGSVFGLRISAIGLAWKRTVKNAGIEELKFHNLRYEAISLLVENTDLDVMEIPCRQWQQYASDACSLTSSADTLMIRPRV